MNRSMKSRIVMAALALGALGATAAANAGTSVHISVGVSPPARAVHVHPQPVPAPVVQPVHMPVHEVHYPAPAYAHEGGYRQQGWQGGCRAERWNPRDRYMPGDVVRRKGELYVARGYSARVWNVNSPPEWTPQYWAPAECR